MGYSLRTKDWRYTAWFVWNGTLLRPNIPPARTIADGTRQLFRPTNGSDGFFDELFGYTPNVSADHDGGSATGSETPSVRSASNRIFESDFDALDVIEVASTYPDKAAELYTRLVELISAKWLQ
jgi:hypothetical protein